MSPHTYLARMMIFLCLLVSRFAFAMPNPAQSAYNSTDPTTLSPEDPSNANAQDLYGFGVRLGIYFQALAFIIGFGNVLRLDPKSQFSGVILAFTILVRWFSRLKHHDISTSELWIGLALIMIVAVPGMWLLFYTLQAQRLKIIGRYQDTAPMRGHYWLRMNRTTASSLMEVTKGQTLNIVQALVVFIFTVVADSWFSYWIISHDHGASYPPAAGTKNVIWLGTTVSVDSAWVKIFMVSQAAVGTAFTAFPTFVYFIAAGFSLKAYWFPSSEKAKGATPATNQGESHSSLVHKRWAYTFGAGLLLLCISLIMSIELTLKNANLTPEMNVERPGQLLPLIAGSVSCISSAADAFGRHIPALHRELGHSRPIGPFTDKREGRSGSYVPLVEMNSGRELRRGSDGRVAMPSPRHESYAESMHDMYADGSEHTKSRVRPVYDGRGSEATLGRTARFEPLRMGPM